MIDEVFNGGFHGIAVAGEFAFTLAFGPAAVAVTDKGDVGGLLHGGYKMARPKVNSRIWMIQ